MAKINIISLSGDSFVNVGTQNIEGVIVTNTDSEDVTFDLVVAPSKIADSTSTTDAVFVLKSIPVPVGSTFIWDDDDILSNIFNGGSFVSKYNSNTKKFEDLKRNTFLIRVGSGHTADVLIRRSV
tara:strand:+ start:198 stop:572 length:375 start_codon:yes stop_codon:yes gene_type:complete